MLTATEIVSVRSVRHNVLFFIPFEWHSTEGEWERESAQKRTSRTLFGDAFFPSSKYCGVGMAPWIAKCQQYVFMMLNIQSVGLHEPNYLSDRCNHHHRCHHQHQRHRCHRWCFCCWFLCDECVCVCVVSFYLSLKWLLLWIIIKLSRRSVKMALDRSRCDGCLLDLINLHSPLWRTLLMKWILIRVRRSQLWRNRVEIAR